MFCLYFFFKVPGASISLKYWLKNWNSPGKPAKIPLIPGNLTFSSPKKHNQSFHVLNVNDKHHTFFHTLYFSFLICTRKKNWKKIHKNLNKRFSQKKYFLHIFYGWKKNGKVFSVHFCDAFGWKKIIMFLFLYTGEISFFFSVA